jgi:YfiR/HmsC-like
MLAVLLASAAAGGQGLTASALRAAFLYNFPKFSEWPADVLLPGQPLAMCVVGDVAIADVLAQTIKGHPIAGHELTVVILKVDQPASGCHLLYVSAAEIKRSTALLLAVNGSAVFTVSDAMGFAESGGVAQLIVEDNRIRLAINIASARRRRLTISSKLLSLATIVNDDRNARVP